MKKYLFIIVVILLGYTNISYAADIYLGTANSKVNVGSTVTAVVYVSSSDKSINSAEGIIKFPTELLSVESISLGGSIFSIWVEQPSFSNSAGTVSFNGGVPNPGFIGNGGSVLRINFKAKKASTAELAFTGASVYANDGLGTDVTSARRGLSIDIISAKEPDAPKIITPPETTRVPQAPEISSATHTDSNKWYAVKDAKFTWVASKDINGVRLAVGTIPQAIPTVLYTSPITSKEVTGLEDGTYYFRVQLRNTQGWGAVSNFKFQIDTKPPEPFTIKFVGEKETYGLQPEVFFDTIDTLSGIDHYKVKIDEGDFFRLSASEATKGNPYALPLQSPGKRTILVQAFDGAGNHSTATAEFVINVFESPTITDYPKELQTGEILFIEGKTKYIDTQISLWLKLGREDAKNYLVKSDEKGKFSFTADNSLKDGIYTAWAEVLDARGAKSEPSEQVTISVMQPAFSRISSWAIGFLSLVIPLLALIIILLFLLWYSWHRFELMRMRLKKEVHEAESALHKAFDLLKEDVHEQIKMLEKTVTKRQLTEEEDRIIKQLKKHFDEAEKFVRKEIEDIEKEVR